MAIKLIAIDMDGTLLLPDHTISPAVKNAIAAARARGVNVVLTTGRPYAGVHNYLKELHMEQPGDYCITYNGALVQKAADGSTVAQTALSYDDYRFLEKLSREVGSHFHALGFPRYVFTCLRRLAGTNPMPGTGLRHARQCARVATSSLFTLPGHSRGSGEAVDACYPPAADYAEPLRQRKTRS